MSIIFICGPYRDSRGPWHIGRNIERARVAAADVWTAGHVAYCPHLNTAFFDGMLPDIVWLDGNLEILRRCDAVLLLDGWENSSGAIAEKCEAERLRIPVSMSLYELEAELNDE